jgi:hypothetical protein
MAVSWMFFPKSDEPTQLARDVVAVFDGVHKEIDSNSNSHSSDVVLNKVSAELIAAGFDVERGKKKSDAISVPVLFGANGRPEKAFQADAWHRAGRFVLEVEAGRAVTNFGFLKDLFEACMMHDIDYLGLAVRQVYGRSQDFRAVISFFDTLYASRRLQLPLKGILVLGY